MAELFSRWESGVQVTAGTMVGSVDGASGLNNYSDRLNSISTDDNLVTGSMISGTSTNIITPYQDTNIWTGSMVSGTSLDIYASDIVTPKSHNSDYVADANFSTTTTASFVTNAGLIANITTVGEPVLVTMGLAYKSNQNGQGGTTRVTRDDETANSFEVVLFVADAGFDYGGALTWIDTPGPGAHTYKQQIKASAGTFTVNDITLSVVELRNHV